MARNQNPTNKCVLVHHFNQFIQDKVGKKMNFKKNEA
jgi:hypothetical protein